MSGFVAAQAVAALEYDFRGFDAKGQRVKNWPKELFDVEGVSPEPTQTQVREKDMALRKLLGLDDDAEGDEITEAVGAVADNVSMVEKRTETDRELVRIYADCCSQQPTTEQMLALPHRTLAAYLGWLAGELNTPTAGSSATKR